MYSLWLQKCSKEAHWFLSDPNLGECRPGCKRCHRPSGPHPALTFCKKREKKNRKEEMKTLFLEYHPQKQAVLYFFRCCLIIRRPPFFFDVPRLIKFIPRHDSLPLFINVLFLFVSLQLFLKLYYL